jgi:hypothetical protein
MREELATGIFQVDFVQQQRIVPPAVEIQERDSTEHLSISLKGKDRFGIAEQKGGKRGLGCIDPRDVPVGDGYQIGQLIWLCRFRDDRGGRQKLVQVVLSN